MKIRQSDITNSAITFSRFSTVTYYTSSAEFQGNVSATTMGLGISNQMATGAPLFVKEFGTSTFGWAEEQDWTIYNVSTTSVFPVSIIAGTGVTASTGNGTIVEGDLVGLFGPATWASATSVNTSRYYGAMAGSKNAAFVFGGAISTTTSEIFNGWSWISLGAYSVINRGAICQNIAAGAANAGLLAGGKDSVGALSSSELFNGASWSSSGNMANARYQSATAGSQNAGVATIGYDSSVFISTTALFNGSSWSSGNNTNLARWGSAASGSQQAMFVAAGATTNTATAKTSELFNGSTWAYVAAVLLPRLSAAGAGAPNAALISGGLSTAGDSHTTTELFNGSTWSLSGNLIQARYQHGGAGSQSGAVMASGYNPSSAALASTELHQQSTYAKVTYENIGCATNIGIACDVTSTTCNVKMNGYIANVSVSTYNSALSTAAQWVDKYMVLSRWSSNASLTVAPSSTMVKTFVEADELVLAKTISRTQAYVYGSALMSLNNIARW